jgi:hypothetical protein
MCLQSRHLAENDAPAPVRCCDLYVRIEAEFREMPGLTLTLPQASRLFGVEAGQCRDVLEQLIDVGWLVTNGHAFAMRRPAPARSVA